MLFVCQLGAVLLTMFCVVGIVRPANQWHRVTSLCIVIAGGAWGLGIFDAGLVSRLEWWHLVTVITLSIGGVYAWMRRVGTWE